MARKNILVLLKGWYRRTIGCSERLAALVSKDQRKFPARVAGLWSEDPLVRMRAANVTEKVTRKNPSFLRPYKKELLGLTEGGQATRTRLASRGDGAAARAERSIVKTFALQGLADLAKHDRNIRPTVIEILRASTRKGTPAMKARSRKLLSHLERE